MSNNKINYFKKIEVQTESKKRISVLRFSVKLIILFLLVNLFVGIIPNDIGMMSIYHILVEPRVRFPFGEAPREAYNFSLFNVEAMFRSHEFEAMAEREEYSVVILGDSSVWGTLLNNDETLAGQLNELNLVSSKQLPVHFYNAGYPTISVTKDLMILNEIQERYHPDAVIWMVTLEAFPWEKQLVSPLVANNSEIVEALLQENQILYDANDILKNSFWDKSIIGKRREIADVIRLQLYGLLWDATEIDQYYPETYNPAQRDLDSSTAYLAFTEVDFTESDLAFDVIAAGRSILDENIPLIVINEPIMISEGENSDIRYNFYYPRWVYDQYREYLNDFSKLEKIPMVDFWNLVPEAEFTNSAIHLSPEGETLLAKAVQDVLINKQLIQE